MEDVSLKTAAQIFDNQTAVDRRYPTFALRRNKNGKHGLAGVIVEYRVGVGDLRWVPRGIRGGVQAVEIMTAA
jgi:hypothetical protein